ncbi:MAG: biopolymer transporter ExbD [Deltaproteobacteria bacterium]|jgi:biopolymer transport protein ExbD|nr:biopolymer transporter ExbD [Deltaproteobacteria bacterium]
MEDKPIDTLNMIPLIDIMLVLLTIVLTTSSFIATGRIPVRLPQASAADPDSTLTVKIEIDSKGVVYYEENPVEVMELRRKLDSLDRKAPILLRADRTVQLQRFIDVADELKGLKFTKVAVQTIKSDK